MASPAPCLLVLRAQVDGRWPGRSRASDGIMGDSSHQARKSDHNQGNAIDITSWGNPDIADMLAEWFRRQMKSAGSSGRITYIIRRRRIASARTGWEWELYNGPNPHVSHIHISIKASARNETRAWKLG